MLYILLIIIAVGVLLASESGKTLLGWIVLLAVIAGGLYLGFWIVVILISLFSDKYNTEIIDNIFTVIGAIMLTVYAGYGVYSLYKKIKKGELTGQIIKKKAKDLWLEKWRESKTLIVFIILAFSFIAIMLIKSFYY